MIKLSYLIETCSKEVGLNDPWSVYRQGIQKNLWTN